MDNCSLGLGMLENDFVHKTKDIKNDLSIVIGNLGEVVKALDMLEKRK